MKNIIYYFTGTGNSLAVARDVAEKLGDTEVKPISKNMGVEIGPDIERVGIACPVYAWGPPVMVARFAEQLKIEGDPYAFALVTCGGSAGNTVPYLGKRLKKSGHKLSSGFVFFMPANYVVWGEAEPEEKQKGKFERKDARMDEVVGTIKDKKTARLERSNFLIRGLTSLIYKLFKSGLCKADRKFIVEDTCNGCGTCEKVCPAGDIELKDAKPVWLGKCEQCYACIQWCPQEAIQVGKKTQGKKRYHHPDVKLGDLIKG